MSLVQLTLPDEKPVPLARRRVAGIDLGTTNSLVATVVDGEATIIEDEPGARLLPSVVDYEGTQVVAVGNPSHGAPPQAGIRRVFSAKRLIGLGWDDIAAEGGRADHPCECVPRSNPVELQLDDGATVSPVKVSAEILSKLSDRASRFLGGVLDAAVITVPAYFDDAQRQATKDAARLAGIEVLRLLNEPTAAALAYGLDQGEQGTYVVYDMGGGTFDVSILRLTRGLFQVLATDGNARLGGDDFDAALARLAAKKSGEKFDMELLASARRAKEALDKQGEADMEVGGKQVKISAEEFYAATADLVQRSVDILADCVRRAGVKDDLRAVIMVGGATRMQRLRDAVAQALDVPQHTDLNPDEVVALGAAAQADILAGNRNVDDWLLLDVNPLSLGIETMGGLVERIIPRNSPIPIARGQEFTTHKDGQGAMSVHVVQGERDKVQDCRSLASFSLRGIPPMAAGTARVLVTYRLDADGLLSVSAQERTSGVEAHIEVKPSYGLKEEEVTEMLREAREHAKEDAQSRALAEARVSANSLLDMLRTALRQDASMVGGDGPAIGAIMAKLNEACTGENVDEEAIKDYDDQAVKLDSGNASAYSNRGMAKIELGMHEEAIKDFDRAISLDSGYAVAYSNRGFAKRGLGRLKEAIEDFDQAIRLDPGYAPAYSNRGMAKSELGRHEEAIKDYDEAISLDSGYAAAYSNRGMAKRGLGMNQEAIEDFDQAIRLDPGNASAFSNRGMAKRGLGMREEAIKDFDKAVSMMRDLTAELDRVSEGFSSRRMQEAMRKALTGKSVDELGGKA